MAGYKPPRLGQKTSPGVLSHYVCFYVQIWGFLGVFVMKRFFLYGQVTGWGACLHSGGFCPQCVGGLCTGRGLFLTILGAPRQGGHVYSS